MYRRSALVLLALVLLGAPLTGSAQQSTPAASPAAATSRAMGTKQFTAADLQAFKTIRNATLASDGKWLAYILAPNEGDATVIIRATAEGGKEYKFPIAGVPQATPR